VSFEAECVACATAYWLSTAEAEAVMEPPILARGKLALAEMSARYAAPGAVAAQAARRRFATLRPLRDAVVLLARRLARPWSRRRAPAGRGGAER
jgi:hypothetical protein